MLCVLAMGAEGLRASPPPHDAQFHPPAGAKALCDGHVTGAPGADGRPGAHILWEAHTSIESVATLSERFRRDYAEASHEAEGGCERWRLSAGHTERLLELCPAQVASQPWAGCARPPAARSVILISTLIRAGE